MGLFNGEIIGEDGLTHITLVSFDLNDLSILLLHSLNLRIQFGLFLSTEVLVKQCGFKDIGIKCSNT